MKLKDLFKTAKSENKHEQKFSLDRINLAPEHDEEQQIPDEKFKKGTDPFDIHCEREDGGCCR